MTLGNQAGQETDALRLYLAEVGRFPLLSPQDEIRLGRLVDGGREASATLLASGSIVPAPSRRHLERAIAQGECGVRQLIEANLRLVVTVAKRYRSSPLPLLDLIQEGNLGLMHAARRFDYRLGFRFSSSAVPWISQAITRAIASKSRTIRLPVRMEQNLGRVRHALVTRQAGEPRSQWLERTTIQTGLSAHDVSAAELHAADVISLSAQPPHDGLLAYEEVVEDAAAQAPLRAVEAGFLTDSVRRLLALLDHREREILRLRFGIGEPRRHTLDEVGRRFGLSAEGVRRIEARALQKLRYPAIRSHLDLGALSA